MEFPKEEGKDFGRVLEKDCIPYLEQDSGKDQVFIIRISIINIYLHILNLFIFLENRHTRIRRRNLP